MIVNRTPITVRGRVISMRPLKRTATGSDVISFRIASNERSFDQASGTWSDTNTFYVQVSAWDALARRAAVAALDKQLVVVQGTIFTHNYEKDGQLRSYPEIRAQAIAVDLLSMDEHGRSVRETDQSADPVSRLAGTPSQETASLDDGHRESVTRQPADPDAGEDDSQHAGERELVGAGVGGAAEETPPF